MEGCERRVEVHFAPEHPILATPGVSTEQNATTHAHASPVAQPHRDLTMATTPLFVPSNRYADLYLQLYPFLPASSSFTEHAISVECVEALLAVDDDDEQEVVPVAIPSEAWRQFETALGGDVVWLSTDIYVSLSWRDNDGYRLHSDIALLDGERTIYVLTSSSAREEDVALGYSLLFRLLETSGVSRVRLSQVPSSNESPYRVPAPILSRFLTKTTSLEKFSASWCRLCEPHIHALSADSARSELEVVLICPRLTSPAKLALRTSMQQNQGPTEVRGRLEDTRLLADAIPGNTRLKKLVLSGHDVDNNGHDEITTLMQSLSEDKGIQELKFQYYPLRDETWELMAGALATHPELITLEFEHTCNGYNSFSDRQQNVGVSEVELPEETKLFRAQQIVELLKTNTVLTNVNLRFDHVLIATEIEPRLRINRLRPKFKAITKAPYAWRRPLVGRALDAVSENQTLQFLLLVQNADVLVSNEAPCTGTNKRGRTGSDVARHDASKRACGGTC